eukprot:scaffold92793_cov21-Phaeocystis_antarctica.AAC.1
MAPHEIHVLEWHAKPRDARPPAADADAVDSADAAPTDAPPTTDASAPAADDDDPAAAADPAAYPGLATAVVEYVVRVTVPNLPRADF